MGERAAFIVIAFALSAIIGLYFFNTSQNVTGAVAFEEDTHEMGSSFGNTSDFLFIEPSKVAADRDSFFKELRSSGKDRRALYERYIDVIGPNGILDGIERIWPKCHSEAHDLGKVIFSKVQDIGQSLLICADRCYSGCMHGVLMEAFSAYRVPDDPDGHIDIEKLKPAMNDLCFKDEEMVSSYSSGDCAHGLGHALMFLSGYDIPEAIQGCEVFEQPHMAYYCATGAYMEYVTENDKEDSKTKSLFYPCDEFDYPAACFRYKMVPVANRHYKTKGKTSDLIAECALEGKFRLGCFHGLGNAHMPTIAVGKLGIGDVCLTGSEDEKFVCIEGAMERMAKYHRPRAFKVCDGLENKYKEICLTAVNYGMYNMSKNLTLYLAD